VLAYLDWQEGKSSTAAEGFAKAYALGAHSNRMLWDYGRLGQSSQPQESVKVLKELAALEPNRAEVQIELAWSQYYARQLNEALMTLAGTNLKQSNRPRDSFRRRPMFNWEWVIPLRLQELWKS
jgi:predicted Zn-dependent protease